MSEEDHASEERCCARKDSEDNEELCVCGHPWGGHRVGHPHNCLILEGRNSAYRSCENGCTRFVLDSPMADLIRAMREEA